MDYSASNTALWSPIVQFGLITLVVIIANILRRRVGFIRKSLMPTSVLAGFILLALKETGIVTVNATILETITYHAIALGFIAMTLKIPTEGSSSGALIGSKSGALIVSTYLVQALAGVAVSIPLLKDVFPAAGILLPMGYGQGPGQANNIGGTYEALGFTGGRSFGLSIAAAGYLCACIVGVFFLNVYNKKGVLNRASVVSEQKGSVNTEIFEDENEVPVSESVDRLSLQVAFIATCYLLTYCITSLIVSGLEKLSPGVAATVSSILWGFNFIIGTLIAMLFRVVLAKLHDRGIVHRQYQNNYLLSRISGLAFDIMIVAGIASIDIADLSGYWLPFILMAALGGAVTFIYLKWLCSKIYKGYENEAFFGMYGMLTGTISSGVLLIREIDPDFRTPAANNLVTGSSFGIAFGAPVLLLVSMAPKMLYPTIGIIIVYLAALLVYILKFNGRKAKK